MSRFMDIIAEMDEFASVEFNIGDIVRSGLVRSYLISKTKKELKYNGKMFKLQFLNQ